MRWKPGLIRLGNMTYNSSLTKDYAMKKIMLTGLSPAVSEESVKAAMEKFGPVLSVAIIRDGEPNAPWVIVEMDIGDEQAHQLTSRVTDIWNDGKMLNARILLH